MSSKRKYASEIARAGAKVPAAGAFDPTPDVIPCGFAWSGALYIQQQLGGAGSASQFRIEFSPDGPNVAANVARWFNLALVNPAITVVAGVGFAQSIDTWIVRLPVGNVSLLVELPSIKYARRLRIPFAEYGNVAANQQSTVFAEIQLLAV